LVSPGILAPLITKPLRHNMGSTVLTPSPLAVGRRRSPRYPAVSLSDAINGAHLFATKDKRGAVGGQELAKALGYKSQSGPARTLIGAMRQYGLLEKQGSATRLSDRAMVIILGPERGEKQATAIRQAALTPPLFQDLYATHWGEPENAVKSYLTLRRGFTERGAALAVSTYQATLSFANLTGSGTHSGVPGPTAAGEMPETGRDSAGAPTGTRQEWHDSLLTQTLEVSIPRNFKVDIVVRGDQIRKEDLARIRNQFVRWMEGLEEAFE